ncbi:hypothetical protein D0Y65_010199 [Glycine soja]|uniref:3'-5' exonuclease domain-containing protein n=1 Tax=Glycine soja TaxID=3848 RepID=A0A445L286_GLYSO|nr:hypothetical protein D0Y65_010199 [Glycine soja]
MAMTMTASNNNPTVFFNPTTSKYLVFYDGLTIETIITYKGSIAGKQRVVGLDTEWIPVEKTKKKVAILQLCIENKCLIIQLFHMDNIPQSLRSFLMDSNFEFVGVGNDYGLEYNKGIDVSLLAKKKWPDQISFGAQKFLTKELVYLDMEKSKAVCAREWKSKELT